MSDGNSRGVVPKACDPCRQRKIRCDRSSPCSNCERAGLVCKAPVRHDRPRRTRVLISTQYERKIDLLEEKLDQLVHLVNEVHARSTSHPAPDREHPSPSVTIPTPLVKPAEEGTTGALIPGQSSLSAQSALAVGFMNELVHASPHSNDTSELTDLLGKLRQLVNSFHDRRQSLPRSLFPAAASASPRIPGNEAMPPLETVLSLLQKSQSRETLTSLFLNYFVISGSLVELAVRVYVSADYSEAEYLIVNAAMYLLSSELALEEGDRKKRPDDPHRHMTILSRRNLEQAFSCRRLQLVDSYDMVLALALGAIFAIDICQPSLVWSLVTTASEISTSLGFHTKAGGTDDLSNIPNRSGHLFWMLYSIQKTLSLQLGRSSTIPDCDITVPLPQGHLQHGGKLGMMQYCRDTIKLSNLAARTYERLYSPKSLSNPNQVRMERVLELAQEIRDHCDESNQTNDVWLQAMTSLTGPAMAGLIAASDQVQRLSLLTLVYRAMPGRDTTPNTLNEDCITCARLAIIRHQEYITALGTEDSPLLLAYLNWTILITPFVPFVVLFYNFIQTRATEDLKLMRAFVHSMSLASNSAITKHHSLFQLFYDVAVRYTEPKQGSSAAIPQEDRSGLQSEFDSYLLLLGMQPGMEIAEVDDDVHAGPVPPGDNGLAAPAPAAAAGQSTSGVSNQDHRLIDWFSFHQQFLEMLGAEEGRSLDR